MNVVSKEGEIYIGALYQGSVHFDIEHPILDIEADHSDYELIYRRVDMASFSYMEVIFML